MIIIFNDVKNYKLLHSMIEVYELSVIIRKWNTKEKKDVKYYLSKENAIQCGLTFIKDFAPKEFEQAKCFLINSDFYISEEIEPTEKTICGVKGFANLILKISLLHIEDNH